MQKKSDVAHKEKRLWSLVVIDGTWRETRDKRRWSLVGSTVVAQGEATVVASVINGTLQETSDCGR